MCTKGSRGQGFINYPLFGDSNNIWALLAELLSQAIDTWYPWVLFWTLVQLLHARQRGCVGEKSWNYIFLYGVSNQTEEANNTNSSQTKHVIIGSCLYHKPLKHLRAKSTSGTKLIKHFQVQTLQAKTALIYSELYRKVMSQCQDGDLTTVGPRVRKPWNIWKIPWWAASSRAGRRCQTWVTHRCVASCPSKATRLG